MSYFAQLARLAVDASSGKGGGGGFISPGGTGTGVPTTTQGGLGDLFQQETVPAGPGGLGDLFR